MGDFMGLQQILDKYRKVSFDMRDQGSRFEKLMKAYLLTEPQYRGRFQEVWLWNEFPSRKDFGGKDLGIDLVAKTTLGEYWAIQCKFFKEDSLITKPQVDTFISTSGKSFEDTEEIGKRVKFSHRLWIDTTSKGFNPEAEKTVHNQTPPVSRINLYELMDSEVDWDKIEAGLSGANATVTKKTPREHQKTAIRKCNEHFQSNDRGKLIMACGTGKTFTSLKIAEDIATNGSGFVLFLVPSIALLGQTLKEWASQSDNPLHAICVCSDPKVSKKNIDDDITLLSTVDLALPATTDSRSVAAQFMDAALLKQRDNGLIVIFSTYQSIDAVKNAQNYLLSQGKQAVFDLIVCDEAHRTTGVTLKDDEESAFVRVHDPDFIKANKRLYMTATPRLYSEDSQKKAKDKEAILCSMDDTAIYGEEFYRLGFGEAVEKQLLSDYKVIVLTIDEDQLSAELQQSIANEDSEIPTDDALKLIGCINALSKRTKETSTFSDVDPGLMHSAVAFCQNIKISKRTVEAMNACRDAYYKTLPEEERREIVSIEADHVDGTMGATIRDAKLSKLKKVSREGSECQILMNVRCLSEGVDVPTLDAILFLSARNSQIDVVQSVGRVMRTAQDKNYGYIIIPVVIPSNVEPEDALEDNKRFAVVWTVLNALRAHDDRFNAIVNKLELNQKKPGAIIVTPPNIGGTSDGRSLEGSEKESSEKVAKGIAVQMELQFEKLQSAVYAKMVEKCGDRRYWEQWAADIAKIAERHITHIKKLISIEGSRPQNEFRRFLNGLRKNINPSVSEGDAVEMLAQHYITQPVFEALFQNYSFAQNNPVSKAMQGMISILNERTPEEDSEKLERFYESVAKRAADIDNAEAKQRIIVELYDKFFKTAFPRTVERLGIVYTPVEIVDFIISSVEDILKKEFGRSLTEENIHILDPFTGTGTFVTRLLQQGIISKEDLKRKYQKEIHANEIVLLAYYIASINIENVFHDLQVEQLREDSGNIVEYTPFEGICLTDTFQLGEDDAILVNEVFPKNSQRVNNQKKAPMMVILGNPPYSVGQKTANDNAQNQKYTKLDSRIADTYVQKSSATLRNSLYDSYIKAFRWSSDRINEETGGIIGFVTNAGWIDGNATAGFRKCIEKEFNSVYVFNLRGNCRTQGEIRRKEAGNVFGLGSRTPIAITILVKKPGSRDKAKIQYFEVDDYLSQKEKLQCLSKFGSILSPKMKRNPIIADSHGDWISKRNNTFQQFITIGDKKSNKKIQAFFNPYYSNGLKTNRDAWCYNFSESKLKDQIKSSVDFFNKESIRLKKILVDNPKSDIMSYVVKDLKKFSWDRAQRNDIIKNKKYSYNRNGFFIGMYRPFMKQHVYMDRSLNNCVYQLPMIFPHADVDNRVICISGMSGSNEYSALISNILPDLHLVGDSQCFSLFYFERIQFQQGSLFDTGQEEFLRRDGLTDFIHIRAKEKYGPRVTKEDIFYYVYGILHSETYKNNFSNDLKKMLPRMPLVSEPAKFWSFSKAGRQLADLHINYESVPHYQDVIVTGDESNNFEVQKMRFPSKNQKDTIIYNNRITITNIPEKAYQYVVNGKSAIEWIMERYQITVHKDSQIKNDPNDWAKEHNQPRYILDLLLSIINVSVQTVDIVNDLPEVNWDME